MSEHHHAEPGQPRRILGIRFGKKPKPKPKPGIAGPDGLSVGGTPVGCCGSCVGDKPVR